MTATAEAAADRKQGSGHRREWIIPPPKLLPSWELRAFFEQRGGQVPATVSHTLRFYSPEVLGSTLLKGILESYDEAKAHKPSVLLFPARKMACLYWALKRAGLKLTGDQSTDQEPSVAVETDRFALLMEAQEWRRLGRHVFLCDDTWVTGRVLERRGQRLIDYLEKLGGPGDAPDVTARALLFAGLNDEGITDEITIAWRREAQRAIAKTLADAGVPYFTDFPVSREILLTKRQLVRVMSALDPDYADVTNAAIAVSSNYAYTLSADACLNGGDENDAPSEFLSGLMSRSHAMKLRVFARRIGGRYGVRFMPKVILGEQTVESLLKVAELFGIDFPGREELCGLSSQQQVERLGLDDDTERLSVEGEVLKQLFGYVEYLASHLLFEELQNRVSTELFKQGSDANVEVDEELARFLLGSKLYECRRQHLEALCAFSLDFAPEDPKGSGRNPDGGPLLTAPSQGPQGRVVPQRGDAGPCPIAVGDDIVEPVDDKLTAGEANSAGIRVDFVSLREQTGHNDWTLSLTLDVLNDLGRAVPDQMLRLRSDGRVVVQRSYRKGESSNPIAEVERTLTRGKLARLDRTIRVLPDGWEYVFKDEG